MWVAYVGEDDLFTSFDTLSCRKVDLAAHSVLALLHAFGNRVIGENFHPGQGNRVGFERWHESVGLRERGIEDDTASKNGVVLRTATERSDLL